MEHPEIYQELEELYEKEKYYIMYEKQSKSENIVTGKHYPIVTRSEERRVGKEC